MTGVLFGVKSNIFLKTWLIMGPHEFIEILQICSAYLNQIATLEYFHLPEIVLCTTEYLMRN